MTLETIEREFKQKVCDKLQLVPEGVNRYRVFTPFMFEDGDHLSIVLKRVQNAWLLSDEGHTYMHLTYDIDEKDLRTGTRQKIISNALASFFVEDHDGELIAKLPEGHYGDALYSFVQALLRVSDVSFLSRERVRSTFLEDFREFIATHVPRERWQFDWHDSKHDPEGRYLVDCRVNGMARPLFIYALPSDDKVRDATISVLQFERWQLAFKAVGIFEDQEAVNRKVLARFSDVVDRQFSNLAGNEERIAKYLEDALAGGV
jgi:Domain of unknown function DUF1828